jgi:uncharacterized protein YbjT (DUF2867 family)
MKVILFGATGMVGQGVLRECLLDEGVERVLAVGRTPLGETHDRLRELVHKDMLDFAPVAAELRGYDACFFCLGVTSAGMSEEDYTRVTYGIAVAAAKTLLQESPGATFIFVSGMGTDSTEKSKTMWARVKGKAENALLAMPFKAVYAFRPAFIQPLHGIRSKTTLYNAAYAVIWPFVPLLRLFFREHMTTTERVGKAMLRVAREGAPKRVLENVDIDALGLTP